MTLRPYKLLLIQILLVVTLGLYMLLRGNGAPVFLFWPIFWSMIITSFFIVLKSPTKYKIISLVILEIGLCIISIASAPNAFQMSRDVYFESGYASTIIEEGRWNPQAGVGFAEDYYGYNPALHFILAFSSITTGLTTYVISKYIFFILLRVILVLSVALLISTFINKNKERIVYLATFFFISSFGMAFIEISRRLIASIFMVLALYALIKGRTEPKNKMWDVLFYVFSLLVFIGNHSIAILFLIILFGITLFGLLTKTKMYKKLVYNKNNFINDYPNTLPKLIYFFVVFYAWQVIVSFVLLKNDVSYVSDIFNLIAGGFGITSLLGSGGSTAAAFVYHAYETGTLYLYHLAFVLLGFIGLIFFIKNLRSRSYFENKTVNKNLLLFMGIFSFVMYIFGFALIRTNLDSASYTFLWFFCIAISLFIAYFIDEIYTRHAMKGFKKFFFIFLTIITILLFTGHAFSGIYTPRITNREPDENIVLGRDIRSQTPEIYYSAVWLNDNANKNSKLIGDVNVFETYSGLFNFKVSTDEFQLNQIYNGDLTGLNDALYSDGIYFGAYEHTADNYMLDYIIINIKHFSEPNDMFGEPVGIEKAEKFDQTELANKVYDNKEIQIFDNVVK